MSDPSPKGFEIEIGRSAETPSGDPFQVSIARVREVRPHIADYIAGLSAEAQGKIEDVFNSNGSSVFMLRNVKSDKQEEANEVLQDHLKRRSEINAFDVKAISALRREAYGKIDKLLED